MHDIAMRATAKKIARLYLSSVPPRAYCELLKVNRFAKL